MGVSPIGVFAVSVWVSPTETWHLPPLVFRFQGGGGSRSPRGPRDLLGLLYGVDALPLVRCIRPVDMAVGEAILARLPELSVASAAKFSDLKKAERAALSDGWGDGVAVHAVLHEVLEGDWQLAVVETAVVGHLDLDAGEDAVGR